VEIACGRESIMICEHGSSFASILRSEYIWDHFGLLSWLLGQVEEKHLMSLMTYGMLVQ